MKRNWLYSLVFLVTLLLVGCRDSDHSPLRETGNGGADTTAPTVMSVTPISGATNVAVGTTVTATFSEAVLSSTVSTTSFKLLAGTNAVSGTVTLDSTGKTATFTPGAQLSYATTYTAVISTAVTDLAGNSVASDFSWSFTTSSQVFTQWTLESQYHALNVVCDASGNVYAYGYYGTSVTDIFVASFSSSGASRWFKTIATADFDWPQGGMIVANGNVYIQRIRDPLGTGSAEVYVEKRSADTGEQVWSTLVDTAAMGSSLALDASNNVYATTTKSTVKLDTSGAVVQRVSNGGYGSAFAFNGLFVAGVSYIDVASMNDRYLVRLDANLSSQWTAWRADSTKDQDVRGVAASSVSSFVYVAEDSFVSSASGATFAPYVSGYTWNASSNTVSLAWTKSLTGGRINASAISVSGSCYIASRVPNTLLKLKSDGTVEWTATLASEPVAVAEYNNAIVYVADDTNVIKLYDAISGTKK